jgi:hypothetical protein
MPILFLLLGIGAGVGGTLLLSEAGVVNPGNGRKWMMLFFQEGSPGGLLFTNEAEAIKAAREYVTDFGRRAYVVPIVDGTIMTEGAAVFETEEFQEPLRASVEEPMGGEYSVGLPPRNVVRPDLYRSTYDERSGRNVSFN